MSELRVGTARGRWTLLVPGGRDFGPALELAQALEPHPAQLERISFDGREAFVKAGPLGPSASRRHGLRRLFYRQPAPRLREYGNLNWLRARHFRALEALAAGCLERHGRPRFQFLVTRELPAVRSLFELLESDPSAAHELLPELAREAARLHSLHFVHRDLFARNMLVADAVHGRRLVFSDVWAGGARPGLRGPAYDIACFLLQGVELASEAAIASFLATYLRERCAQGSSANEPRFLAQVERERSALVRQLEREPQRLRGRPMPRSEWSVPVL